MFKTNERNEKVDLGDETGDESSPRPDENVVSEIGEEVGVDYHDEEPLHTVDKVADRDRQRWELDPLSSEDYAERQQPETSSDDDQE